MLVVAWAAAGVSLHVAGIVGGHAEEAVVVAVDAGEHGGGAGGGRLPTGEGAAVVGDVDVVAGDAVAIAAAPTDVERQRGLRGGQSVDGAGRSDVVGCSAREWRAPPADRSCRRSAWQTRRGSSSTCRCPSGVGVNAWFSKLNAASGSVSPVLRGMAVGGIEIVRDQEERFGDIGGGRCRRGREPTNRCR